MAGLSLRVRFASVSRSFRGRSAPPGMAGLSLRGRVALLRISSPPVNSLSLAVRRALLSGIEQAQREGAKALVIAGSGPTFPAGSDIDEFAGGGHLKSPTLRAVIQEISRLNMHTVAAIHGTALGGGLELALACHWRVAHPDSHCGLPEVHLGLLPESGGTQRLPRLVGLDVAIQMLSSGSPVRAEAALSAGLVDKVIVPRQGLPEDEATAEAGIELAESLVDQPIDPLRNLASRPPPQPEGGIAAYFDAASARIQARSHGWVAPVAAVHAVRAAVESPSFAVGMRHEAALCRELSHTNQASALQHAFFAERALARVEGTGIIRPIRSVVVIGAGTMGTGITMCFANAGFPVTIVEQSQAALARGLDHIRSTYASRIAKKRITRSESLKSMKLISAASRYTVPAVREADLVVEAAFERLEVKKEIFMQLDKLCKPAAILASNTSYLSIDEIAAVTTRPHAVAGMHFFSPAHVMPLLENVRGSTTDDGTIATIMWVGAQLRKKAVLARNCPGFIANRMLEGYLREALYMIEEGCMPAEVDSYLRHFGMPIGPFQLSDLAGNDVGYAIRRNSPQPPTERYYGAIADRLVEAGRLGQKSRGGWYDYPESKTGTNSPTVTDLIHRFCEESHLSRREINEYEVIDRCLLPVVNEGFKVLEEGVALRESDIDMAWIHGFGFPRYKGGPMFWARHLRVGGLRRVEADLERYAALHPSVPHWTPAKLLRDEAAAK